jgi:alkylation response protein AidB-like acyl-CoA dehydrogenase
MRAEDVLQAARSLEPAFDAEAEAIEAAGAPTPTVVAALLDAGLFHFLVPRELGGSDADVITALQIFEATAHANPTVGWTVLVNATVTGSAAAYFSDEAARTVFGAGDAVLAGFLAGGGIARPVDGGYKFSGSFRFGSATGHSTYIGGGGFVVPEGEDPPDPLPPMAGFCAFVPRSAVRFTGGWDDVIGLRGSGSVNYEIDEIFVDKGFTIAMTEAPRRGGPVQKLGLGGMIAIGQAGWPLGVAQRALDEVIALAPKSTRMMQAPTRMTIGEQQMFQYDFAYHEAAVDAARALVHKVFSEAVDYTRETGSSLSYLSAEFARLGQATTYAFRVCLDAVLYCYRAAGTRAVHSSPLERCVRDMLIGNQHAMYADMNLIRRTQNLLGITPDYLGAAVPAPPA